MEYQYDSRQLSALSFCASLAPAIRLMPRYCADAAGKAGWLSPLFAAPFLVLYVLLLRAYMKRRRAGEGLGELILRTGGKAFGSFVLCVAAAFLLFCCGFILRSGAERFICTVFPAASPWVFVGVMLVLGLIAALGPKKALVRSARIFAPILCTVILVVLAFTLTDLDLNLVLPVTDTKPVSLLKGAVPMLELYAGMLAYTAVFEGGSPKVSGRGKREAYRCVPVCLLFSLLCFCAIGSYGAPLIADFSHPFFAVIRNVSIFRTVEHIEAIVVALWVLPDFVVFALMLGAAAHFLRLVLGFVPGRDECKLSDMKNGRWLILAGAAVSLAVSLFIDASSQKLELYSEVLVPASNMLVVLLLIPLCFLICVLRERRGTG